MGGRKAMGQLQQVNQDHDVKFATRLAREKFNLRTVVNLP
jgi:hypothetical protein